MIFQKTGKTMSIQRLRDYVTRLHGFQDRGEQIVEPATTQALIDFSLTLADMVVALEARVAELERIPRTD